MTQEASKAVAAARVWYNLGRKAGAGYCRKHGVSSRLYVLACQLLATSKAMEVEAV